MNIIIGTRSLRPWLGQRRRSFKVADLQKISHDWSRQICRILVNQTFLLYSAKFTSKSHFLSKSDFLHPLLTIHPNDVCLLCLLQVFPCPLVSPYCQNFQPSIKLWPTILNRNQRWNGFRVKLFLSYFTPKGPISSPECWMWIKICDNRWKFVEIFLIPPRAPIPQSINPTLQSEPGDKILPQRGNNQTTTTRFPHSWWRWWGRW